LPTLAELIEKLKVLDEQPEPESPDLTKDVTMPTSNAPLPPIILTSILQNPSTTYLPPSERELHATEFSQPQPIVSTDDYGWKESLEKKHKQEEKAKLLERRNKLKDQDGMSLQSPWCVSDVLELVYGATLNGGKAEKMNGMIVSFVLYFLIFFGIGFAFGFAFGFGFYFVCWEWFRFRFFTLHFVCYCYYYLTFSFKVKWKDGLDSPGDAKKSLLPCEPRKRAQLREPFSQSSSRSSQCSLVARSTNLSPIITHTALKGRIGWRN
jgi:hypothetical protein